MAFTDTYGPREKSSTKVPNFVEGLLGCPTGWSGNGSPSWGMDAESEKLDDLRLEDGLLRREVEGEMVEFPPNFSDIEAWRVDLPPFCSEIEGLGVKRPPICSDVEGLRGEFEAQRVESPPKWVEIGVVREERDRVKGLHERSSHSSGA